jgi:hypothetical protein
VYGEATYPSPLMAGQESLVVCCHCAVCM